MQILPPTVSPAKGREKSELGGAALSGASSADPNPDKQHAAYMVIQGSEAAEEESVAEALSSRLIISSPISSETQAALLALLSEPQSVSGVPSRSFDELVREAVPGDMADVEDKDETESEYDSVSDLRDNVDTLPGDQPATEVEFN